MSTTTTKAKLKMALIKKASDAKTSTPPAAGTTLKGGAAVEADPTEANTAGAAAAAAAPTASAPAPAAASTPAAAPTPSAETAVAVAKPNAGALAEVGQIEMMDVIAACKNRYRVDWNTLDRVQANNGNFLDLGKNKESMGDVIQLRLLSWQDSWQISPGSNDAASKAHVRYSDDGKTTTLGENIEQYLQKLREMYPKAKCDHRVVVAGELVGSTKNSRLEGHLVQLDLSKMSKAEFDKHQINTAFKIGRGLLKPEQALLMTMTAEVKNGQDGTTYTIAKFEPTL